MRVEARVQHVQEVLRVPKLLVGRRGSAPRVPVVRVRRERGHLADDAHNLLILRRVRAINVPALQRRVLFRVEGGQGVEAGEYDAHGVRVVR